MMFARQVKLTFGEKLRQALWPSMGWDRTISYYGHRLMRGSASTHSITNGLSIGAAVSFIPLIGTHLFVAFFFAWIFRTNKISAFLGTAVGNPFTFPFIFWLDYKVGVVLFDWLGRPDLAQLPERLSWRYLLDHPFNLFAPLMLGGVVVSILAWPISYAVLYYPVHIMRKVYRDYRNRE